MKTVKIGTRESNLAMIQSRMVKAYIEDNNKEVEVELVPMKTTGDVILDRTLDKVGGKGLFVKELDLALRDNRSDISVHSLKDVPMEVPEDLPLLGFSKREDPRDVLVLPKGATKIDKSLPIGCSSQRRIIQLQQIFPDAEFKSVRGNLQTRLRKLDEGQYGALILAAAGLKRSGMEDRISRYFEPYEAIPACGQGVLCIQGRENEEHEELKGFFDEETTICVTAERAFVSKCNGGCSSPIAAFAEILDGEVVLNALYCPEGKTDFVTGCIKGDVKEAEKLGCELADQLMDEYNNR